MRDKWTDRQKRIFEGLSAIGQEIAGFYEAGLNMYFGDIPNGAYFLLHAAREIDGGLRDVLAVDYTPEEKESDKHKKSILFSLGAKDLEGLAEDWFTISKKLHRYAHRHGAWKLPRQLEEVRPLWDQYENILERLVGSYYAIIERVERIGKIGNLQGGVVETLCNILAIPTYYNFFFRSEKDIKWFTPLNKKGWFSPEEIKFDEQNNAMFWNVLDYLERVSEQVAENPQYGKELIAVIENVVHFSQNKKRINNYHIWWYCVKILNNLPSNIIQENLSVENFRKWLAAWTDHSMGSALAISDLGQKLLPKFLAADSTIEFAETIIYAITEIKAGEKPDAFTKRGEAVLVWHSHWIMDTFRKYHKSIGEKCSLKVVYHLADALKRALEHKQKEHYVNLDIGSEVYQIKVSRTPREGLNVGHIGFKDGQYECVITQFSQDQLKAVDRHSDYWALHNIEPQIDLKQFAFTASERDGFILAIKENLPSDVNWTTAEKFDEKLEYIFDGLYSDYSHIWFKSLVSGGRDHARDADEVLTTALRDVLLAKCEANRQDGKKVLDDFLSNRYLFPIFKRFVLLCIDKFWPDYAEFIDSYFKLIPTALEESDYEIELQDVLLHHNSEFSGFLKSRLKELINNIPEYYVEKGEKATAYWKYKWFSPLRNNPNFHILYEEALQKAEPKDGKPYEPERTASMGGYISHKSPVSREDILQKPIAELVKYLGEFKGADFWKGAFEGEPDKEGLADTLQAAVKDEPGKFTNEIDVFYAVDYFYLHRIFRGLKEAWNASKEIDWEKVFNFMLKYFGQDIDPILEEALQAQGEDSGEGRYIWIVDEIVELIADGCKDDKRAFDPIYFDTAEQIFELVTPLLKGERQPDTQRDALTYALNTTLGRTIRAYVSFSLRVARATLRKEEGWGQNRYERFFDVGIDAYIWFGCYLPQMKYLDEKYTTEKIDFFARKDSSDFEWQMFMEGYLTGASFYPYLYHLMRANYLKGLANKVFEEHAEERLIQHICIGYLQTLELLRPKNSDGQDSLFWKMLTEAEALGKRGRWLVVASYFWSLTGRTIENEDKCGEEEISEEHKKKILEFWAWTYDQQAIVKANLGDDYNSFLGRIAELTILLDMIDDRTEEWLILSAPHIDRHHDATLFIEYLTKFADDESIKRLGRIFLKVLENATPTFRQEDIELIVRRLYEKGDRDDAEAICNTYGRRGVHFLKPVWEEYQKKKHG